MGGTLGVTQIQEELPMDPTTLMEEIALMGVRVTGILAILGFLGSALRRDPAGGPRE